MSYLDQIGSVFQQIYKKPKYIQIGTTRVYEPMRVNLDRMYQRYETPVMPEAPTPKTYTPPMPETYVPTVGMGITEQYPEQEGWQKWTSLTGTEIWMPTKREDGTPIQQGDIYTNTAGEKYYWDANLKTWLKLKPEIDAATGTKKWIIDPEAQPFVGTDRLGDLAGKPVTYETPGVSATDIEQVKTNYEAQVDTITQKAFDAANLGYWVDGTINLDPNSPAYKEIQNIVNNVKDYIRNLRFQGKSLEAVTDDIERLLGSYGNYLRAKMIASGILNNADPLRGLKEQLDYYTQLENLPEALGGKEITPQELVSWTEGFQDLLKQIDEGKITYLTDEGQLDTSQLRQMGVIGNWFADVLENSYKTGLVAGDIIQYNEQTGQYELAPELQEMERQIGLMNEENKRAFQEFNRQLALNAIASGHSLNSGFYSDYIARGIAEYSANVADQISSVMMNEIQSQYQYIANSLVQGLRDIGAEFDTEAFMAEINNQWDQIQQQFQEQIELLAQQASEIEAQRMGEIMTSALTLAVHTLLAIFGGI